MVQPGEGTLDDPAGPARCLVPSAERSVSGSSRFAGADKSCLEPHRHAVACTASSLDLDRAPGSRSSAELDEPQVTDTTWLAGTGTPPTRISVAPQTKPLPLISIVGAIVGSRSRLEITGTTSRRAVPWPGTRTTWSESAHVGTSTLRLVCPGATVPWTLIVLLAHWPVMVDGRSSEDRRLAGGEALLRDRERRRRDGEGDRLTEFAEGRRVAPCLPARRRAEMRRLAAANFVASVSMLRRDVNPSFDRGSIRAGAQRG